MSSTAAGRPAGRRRAAIWITLGVVVALVIVFFVFAGLYADMLWYQQLGYLNVLTTQWIAAARPLLHRLPRHGRAALADDPARVPAPPGLRQAQLAARPLPAGDRAAAPARDVRHPGRVRHLRGRLDRQPLADGADVDQPHDRRQDRSAVPPRRLVLRLRPAVLPRARRLRVGRRHHLAVRGAGHQLPLRRHPHQRPRGAHLEGRTRPDLGHRGASTCCCRASASGSTSMRR